MAHPFPPLQIDDLLRLLTEHLPYALPVLGSLSALGEVTEIYTSFLPYQTAELVRQQTDGILPFFIVLTHMTGGKDSSDQSRIYCSSEQAKEKDDKDSQLVYAFVESYMSQVPPSTTRLVGTIHARWVDVLGKNTSYVSPEPVAQWIAPPLSINTVVVPAPVPDVYYVDRLGQEDVSRVIATSKQARSSAYIHSRLRYSICLRAVGTDTLVAWGLLHSDCSIGTIYVEPEHRGKKLARVIVERLPSYCGRDTTGGYKFSNVAGDNHLGNGLFGTLRGWKFGWDTYWIHFVPAVEWKR